MADVALFEAAVAAIDAGDSATLKTLLAEHPELVRDRWHGYSADAYFADPYLLWFVANNPIRDERMPPNIGEIAGIVADAAKRDAPESAQAQLDYTVALVASGCVPREAGVQLELIDVLVDAGANPDALATALAHRETAAAQRLLERGAPRSLLTVACLEDSAAVDALAEGASAEELRLALCGAAVYGNQGALRSLLAHGAEPNTFCPDGFHAHSTPLHQAVLSGSLDAVRALLDAGADASVRDRGFDSTPLDWAEHEGETEIAAYLRSGATA